MTKISTSKATKRYAGIDVSLKVTAMASSTTPVFAQKLLFAVLAPLARMAGYKTKVEPVHAQKFPSH